MPRSLATIRKRWGLTWKEVAVFVALAYVAPIGGTRAGTFHFPLVMFSHLAAMVLLIAWSVHTLRQRRWLPRTPLDLPLLVFYLLNVVSTVFSTEPRLSLENLAHLTIFILIYYLVVDLLVSGWKVTHFVRPLLIMGSVIILAELLELALWFGIWFVGTGETSPLLILGDYRRRIIMGPANVLAWYVVLLLPLALAQLLMSRSLRSKINLGAWVIGGMVVFASTLSRSALVGMAVAMAAFALLGMAPRIRFRDRAWLPYLRRPAAIVSMALAIAMVALMGTAAVRLARLRTGSISIRLELWRAGAHIISRHPLLGGGPGTFGYLFHQVPDFNPSGPDVFYNNAHNGYLNVAAETGVPSLLVGLWLLAALVAPVWKSARKGEGTWLRFGLVANACLTGILGLLAATLFDVPWVFPLTTLHVILLAAIAVRPYCSPRRMTTPVIRPILPGLLALLVVFFAWSDSAHYLQQRAVESLHDGNLPAAVQALRRSVSIDPFLSMYRFQLGIAEGFLSLERGDNAMLRRAMGAFEAEISRGGDAAVNNSNLAWLKWNAGEIDQAVAHMQRAAALAPRESYYQLGLGYLLEEGEDYEAARGAYAQAIVLEPDLVDSGFWEARAHWRSVKADLLAEQNLPPLAMAKVAYYGGDYTAGIQLLDRLPASVHSYVLRARIEMQRGDYDAALENLNSGLEVAPNNGAAHLARGQLYLLLGKESQALPDLRTASLLREPRADIALADIAYRSGDLDKAIALYESTIPGCRKVSFAYDYASQVYHRSDLRADFWPEALACMPYESLVPQYLRFARAYRDTGQAEEADTLCRWLASFYDSAFLRQLDEGDVADWPCPAQQP